MTEPHPQYAVIHVSTGESAQAWPVVERVRGGWQSGAHHYPDADVMHVHQLRLSSDVEPAKRLLADILTIVNRHQGFNAQQAMDEIHQLLGVQIDTWLDEDRPTEPRGDQP